MVLSVTLEACLKTFQKRINVNIWSRDCFSSILVENVAAFCLCVKSLPKAKVKFRSIPLAKEISKEPSINSVVW